MADSHPATTQTLATTAYRYTGKNPDNYVSFNNELWRIIGIFDVDDGTGTLEQRIKLIRNESIGNIIWDGSNENDWTTATGMTLLNSGNYWNRTADYSSKGLTEEAKTMIDNAKWYLGGSSQIYSASAKASQFYIDERGTTVYSGRPTSWTGKVGLMYVSDYGYATGGGTTTNRNQCLEKDFFGWSNLSSYAECYTNNWLHDTNRWTITPDSGSSSNVLVAYEHITSSTAYTSYFSMMPSVYLKPNIKITGGTGTESDPYQLSL